jgi:hypothetical protein
MTMNILLILGVQEYNREFCALIPSHQLLNIYVFYL